VILDLRFWILDWGRKSPNFGFLILDWERNVLESGVENLRKLGGRKLRTGINRPQSSVRLLGPPQCHEHSAMNTLRRTRCRPTLADAPNRRRDARGITRRVGEGTGLPDGRHACEVRRSRCEVRNSVKLPQNAIVRTHTCTQSPVAFRDRMIPRLPEPASGGYASFLFRSCSA
jgi:hypothetical protein